MTLKTSVSSSGDWDTIVSANDGALHAGTYGKIQLGDMTLSVSSTGQSQINFTLSYNFTGGTYSISNFPIEYSELSSISGIYGGMTRTITKVPSFLNASGSATLTYSVSDSSGSSLSFSHNITVSLNGNILEINGDSSTCKPTNTSSGTYTSSFSYYGKPTIDISTLTTSVSNLGTSYRKSGNCLYIKDGTITVPSYSATAYFYLLISVAGDGDLEYGNLANSGTSLNSSSLSYTWAASDTSSINISALTITYDDSWIFGIGA